MNYENFKKWFKDFKAGKIVAFLFLIIFTFTFFKDHSSSKVKVIQNHSGNGDNVAGNKTMYYNGIPTPEIHLQKISSSTLITGLLGHGQYSTDFILDVDSIRNILEIDLWTNDGTKVIWMIRKETNPGIFIMGSESVDNYKIKDAQGKYLISTITPKPQEINLEYN